MYRYTVEFNEEQHERLIEMKNYMGLKTNSEVINRALCLLSYLATSDPKEYKLVKISEWEKKKGKRKKEKGKEERKETTYCC